MPPTVSVIIPTCNRYPDLLRAVASVARQEDAAVELLVVDDCSTDPSYASLETDPVFLQARQKLHAIRRLKTPVNSKSQFGVPCPSPARNLGLLNSTGDYVAFLDHDDVWIDPHKLAKQFQAMNETATAMACCEALTGQEPYRPGQAYPRMNTERHWAYISQRLGGLSEMPRLITRELLIRHNVLVTSSVMVRRQCVMASHGFPVQFRNEDYDLWLELMQTTDCVYLPDAMVYYNDTPASERITQWSIPVGNNMDESNSGM